MLREYKGFKDLTGNRNYWFILSIVVIAAGVISLATRGLNLGVDFTGGFLIEYPTNSKTITTEDVENIVRPFGVKHNPPQISSNMFLLRMEGYQQEAGNDKATVDNNKKMRDDFYAKLMAMKIKFRLTFTDVKSPNMELKFLEKPVEKPEIDAFLVTQKDLAGITTQSSVSTKEAAKQGERESFNVKIALAGIRDQASFEKAATALYAHFGGYEPTAEKSEREVSPLFSKELFNRAILALIIATACILIYVSIRFQFWYAVAGIVALFHDCLITLGLYSIFNLEVNSSFVAIILTVFGYSIHDTIVIFDRIRENLRKHKGEDLHRLINFSLWETMPRSINTVLTVEITIICILVLGGESIHSFIMGLFFGITTGCFSSIFIAAPLFFMFKTMGGKSGAGKEAAIPQSTSGKKKGGQAAQKAKGAPAAAQAKSAPVKKKQDADGIPSSGDEAQKPGQSDQKKKDQKKGKQRRR